MSGQLLHATRNAMKPQNHRRGDWAFPLIILIPAVGIAAMESAQAEVLGLPTTWFARTSPIWMLVLVAVSCFISSPKWAKAVWFLGLSCAAYAPLLVSLGSSRIPLSRALSPEESADFRHRFPVPVLLYSASREGHCLSVRRHDLTDAIRTHIQAIGALREQRPGS